MASISWKLTCIFLACRKELGVNFLTYGSSIIGAEYIQADYKDQAAFTGFAVQDAWPYLLVPRCAASNPRD